MATPSHKNLPQGVMKFKILVDPTLVIITTYMVYLIYAREYRRFLKKKYTNFTLSPQNYLPLGLGS